MSFKKNDLAEEKPDFSLLPLDACEGVVRILMMGAKKYSRDNWREGCDDPDAQRRIFSAIFRHMSALQRGETIDPESGESHVLHVACNAMFLAAFSETHRRRAMLNIQLQPDLEEALIGAEIDATVDRMREQDFPTEAASGDCECAVCQPIPDRDLADPV